MCYNTHCGIFIRGANESTVEAFWPAPIWIQWTPELSLSRQLLYFATVRTHHGFWLHPIEHPYDGHVTEMILFFLK
jgi:hypothetical protein